MKKKDNEAESIKKPWPTKDAMEQVYSMKLWGDNKTNYYSGEGSHLSNLVNPYISALTSFLTSFKNPLVVCDLGCGDFNIGKKLVQHTKRYVAIDIVAGLIDYNKQKFKEENLEFQCLDIAKDDLPPGDCAILRQVLQHLSNSEIQKILDKLNDYKYVVLTEHIPNGQFEANKDIISGQGTRLKKQSGINLLVSPFNFKIKETKQIASVVLNDCKEVITTTVYRIF